MYVTSTYTSGISPCQQRTVWHLEGIWIRHGISSFAASLGAWQCMAGSNPLMINVWSQDESRYPEHPGTSRDIPDFNGLYTSNVVNPFHWFPLTGLSSSPRSFRTWQGGHTEESFDEIANALCIVVLCNLSIQDRHRNLMKFAIFALYVESSFDHHLAASWSGRLISGQGSQSLHSASAQDRA